LPEEFLARGNGDELQEMGEVLRKYTKSVSEAVEAKGSGSE
jgi:hypothetical protein